MKPRLEKKIWIFVLVSTVIFLGMSSQQATAQKKGGAEEFYKGATLNFIVPHSPGGPFDLWARALAPYLEKHTGSRMIVQNIEGASGLVGGGQLYAISKPDGLTIGILPLSGMAVAEMLEFDAVKYDLDKYTYIGRVEVISRALFASKASGFKSIADMQKSTKPIRFGTMDPTSSSSVDAAFLAEAFGLKAKLIPGYKGSKEYMLALMAGRELDAASTSLGGYGEQVRKGELVLVAVAGKKRDPDFPAAPTALETPGLKPEDKKWLELLDGITEGGRTIAAPPGVPEERRLFLDKALMSSLKEPGLVEWARKVEYNVSPLSGKECKELVTKMMEIVPKSERPRIKEIITKKYF